MFLSDYSNEQQAFFIGGTSQHNDANYGLYIKALSLITFGDSNNESTYISYTITCIA